MATTCTCDVTSTVLDRPPSIADSSCTPKLSKAESNRINAQRSTGPRSPAGKQRVRFNGLKHGMTARSTVLPGEDPALIEAARRQLHHDLAPRDPLEAILVDRIAWWLTMPRKRGDGWRSSSRK